MKKCLLLSLVAAASLAACNNKPAEAPADDSVYLFSYFTGEKDGLHLAYSDDGKEWKEAVPGRIYLKPVIGQDSLMRDPSIVLGPDGLYHMVWTSSWHDRIIGYASSPDLVNWSEQKAIPVMIDEEDAKNCWAPELYYDEPTQTYYIYWATTIPGRFPDISDSETEKGWNHKIYATTTQDFETFTPTELFFCPDFSVIDAAIVRDDANDDLIMVVKNENPEPPEKNLRVTRTKDIRQGFPTEVSAPINGDYWCEGPAPIFVGDTLYVYFDKYMNGQFGAVRSGDHGQTWEDVSDQVSFPKGIRHGTAFKAPRQVLEGLMAE